MGVIQCGWREMSLKKEDEGRWSEILKTVLVSFGHVTNKHIKNEH